MRVDTLFLSTLLNHCPLSLNHDPIIRPSAMVEYVLTFSDVTPEPTRRGREMASFTRSNSVLSTGAPVDCPVTITPSLRKNSAALAVSDIVKSDVTACELCTHTPLRQHTHKHTHTYTHTHLCYKRYYTNSIGPAIDVN